MQTCTDPLASGIVFQMDQTASSDQDVLWDERERGEVTNLDRRERLPAGGDSEKGTWPTPKPPPDSTDFQFDPIRENSYIFNV